MTSLIIQRVNACVAVFCFCFPSLAEPAIQMVIMSGTATVLQQFVSGLKSRNEDTRAKSAKDLQHYVTTELREVIEVDDPLLSLYSP